MRINVLHQKASQIIYSQKYLNNFRLKYKNTITPCKGNCTQRHLKNDRIETLLQDALNVTPLLDS